MRQCHGSLAGCHSALMHRLYDAILGRVCRGGIVQHSALSGSWAPPPACVRYLLCGSTWLTIVMSVLAGWVLPHRWRHHARVRHAYWHGDKRATRVHRYTQSISTSISRDSLCATSILPITACPAPDLTAQGLVVASVASGTATLACAPGFAPTISSTGAPLTASCDPTSGVWTTSARCLPCSPPLPVAPARLADTGCVDGPTTGVARSCTYECSPGTTAVAGSTQRTCDAATGEWSGADLRCAHAASTHALVNGMNVSIAGLRPESVVVRWGKRSSMVVDGGLTDVTTLVAIAGTRTAESMAVTVEQALVIPAGMQAGGDQHVLLLLQLSETSATAAALWHTTTSVPLGGAAAVLALAGGRLVAVAGAGAAAVAYSVRDGSMLWRVYQAGNMAASAGGGGSELPSASALAASAAQAALLGCVGNANAVVVGWRSSAGTLTTLVALEAASGHRVVTGTIEATGSNAMGAAPSLLTMLTAPAQGVGHVAVAGVRANGVSLRVCRTLLDNPAVCATLGAAGSYTQQGYLAQLPLQFAAPTANFEVAFLGTLSSTNAVLELTAMAAHSAAGEVVYAATFSCPLQLTCNLLFTTSVYNGVTSLSSSSGAQVDSLVARFHVERQATVWAVHVDSTSSGGDEQVSALVVSAATVVGTASTTSTSGLRLRRGTTGNTAAPAQLTAPGTSPAASAVCLLRLAVADGTPEHAGLLPASKQLVGGATGLAIDAVALHPWTATRESGSGEGNLLLQPLMVPDMASPRLVVGTDACPAPTPGSHDDSSPTFDLCFTCSVISPPCTVTATVSYPSPSTTTLIRTFVGSNAATTSSGSVSIDVSGGPAGTYPIVVTATDAQGRMLHQPVHVAYAFADMTYAFIVEGPAAGSVQRGNETASGSVHQFVVGCDVPQCSIEYRHAPSGATLAANEGWLAAPSAMLAAAGAASVAAVEPSLRPIIVAAPAQLSASRSALFRVQLAGEAAPGADMSSFRYSVYLSPFAR